MCRGINYNHWQVYKPDNSSTSNLDIKSQILQYSWYRYICKVNSDVCFMISVLQLTHMTLTQTFPEKFQTTGFVTAEVVSFIVLWYNIIKRSFRSVVTIVHYLLFTILCTQYWTNEKSMQIYKPNWTVKRLISNNSMASNANTKRNCCHTHCHVSSMHSINFIYCNNWFSNFLLLAMICKLI